MKIVNLVVKNFRAINHVRLSDLDDMVVIAGPNGCGKSCILDAIRLFKSAYGGYQPNEWHQWFGEFQINLQRHKMTSLQRDQNHSSIIKADIKLADEEISFVRQNLQEMLENLAWNTIVPSAQNYGHQVRNTMAIAAELRAHKPAVDKKVREQFPIVSEQLDNNLQQGTFTISHNNALITPNILLELLFSSYYPKYIGLIDYHGSHRDYNREQLGGINLDLSHEEDKYKTTSLYNLANKYNNIKSEMAASYIRDLISKQVSGGATLRESTQSLSDTLKELFSIFFPGKKFLGPTPTAEGDLNFTVEVQNQVTHDINDLSSGEKEVLFGYLRLRNSAPKHSVILLDEPELHLNPALVRGLPQFYYKHLSQALENQIWLVTHSDAFLREAIGQKGLRVFHMQYTASSTDVENQIHEIQPGEEVESAILEMVGDLAAYRPGAKVVFFEGESSEFDQKMVLRLFPEIEGKVNLVSSGNRHRVETIHKILERSLEAAGQIPIKIYSVVDKDTGEEIGPSNTTNRHYSWDVYHIENYLLESQFIYELVESLNIQHRDVSSKADIDRCLTDIARNQIGKLITHRIRLKINSKLIGALNLNINPCSDNIANEMHKSIVDSVQRLSNCAREDFPVKNIGDLVDEERRLLENSLEQGNWKKHFKGRDILSTFVAKYINGMRYEHFRDLIVSKMSEANYQPPGMKHILDHILAD